MNNFFPFLNKKNAVVELPFSYAIRRSQRAEKVRIIVKPGKVEVVAPTKAGEESIHRFVQAQQQWVTQALAKMAEKTRHQNLAPPKYGHGAEIPYQGQHFKMLVKPSKLKRIKIEFLNEFIAHVPETIPANEQSELIKAALIGWLKKQAKTQVGQLITQHAHKNRLYPRSVTIKTQKSRWGSCGIHNDIHINWLLLLAPVEVLEYVVVHELCHIREKNHSSHFWTLVAEHLPEYQQHRRWLKQQGGQLMIGL
jgi:predicted metal-dependent hydrolase